MSKFKVLAVMFASIAVLVGCVVQSVHPFYTKEAIVAIPKEMKGEWQQLKESGEPGKDISPWSFTDNTILTVEEKNVKSTLEAVYFKVGESLFVDCTAGEPDKELQKHMNGYWLFSIARIHHVSKVELSGDKLSLTPLNYEWVEKNLKAKNLSLPHVLRKEKDNEEGFPLFTATPKEWMGFLEKYASDKEAFNPKNAFKFQRAAAAVSVPGVSKQP